MAHESRDVTITVGSRLTDAEIKAIELEHIAHVQAQPKRRGSEGQADRICVMCPYCGCVGWCELRTDTVRYFACRCCGL